VQILFEDTSGRQPARKPWGKGWRRWRVTRFGICGQTGDPEEGQRVGVVGYPLLNPTRELGPWVTTGTVVRVVRESRQPTSCAVMLVTSAAVHAGWSPYRTLFCGHCWDASKLVPSVRKSRDIRPYLPTIFEQLCFCERTNRDHSTLFTGVHVTLCKLPLARLIN
jgi:hypothetical protein